MHLRADCARCAGLCCVAPAFARSADFALDKPAGRACPNLDDAFRCRVHADLRERGFSGCVVFDCFGAGQQTVQVTFAGRDWRTSPELAEPMFAVLPVMRQLHELLWYLAEAQSLPAAAPLSDELAELRDRTETLTRADADELLAVDVGEHRRAGGELLRRVSELARGPRPGRDRSGTDLVGAALRGADLRRSSFRSAYLIGADLRRADLRGADLLGTDLRAADLRGADLRDCLFLTHPQLEAAVGDGATRLPESLDRPGRWAS